MIDGKALKRARQAAQLTQAGLARAVGMSAQQLAAIEQGRVKTTKFLGQFARVLNMRFGEIDPDWAAFDQPRPTARPLSPSLRDGIPGSGPWQPVPRRRGER